MQKPKLQQLEAETEVFARSRRLFARWLNVAEARRRARDSVERAKVSEVEDSVVSDTVDFLDVLLDDSVAA